MSEKIKKNSNSHANLEIINCLGEYRVRKIFTNDLTRIENSLIKQRCFKQLQVDGLKIESASIIDQIIESDRTIIQMPYVEGICGADFAIFGGRATGEELSKLLIKIIDNELCASTLIKVPSKIFLEKIDSINISPNLIDLKKSYLRARNFVLKNQEFYEIPSGACHGDLTLSNVIYQPGSGIFLIDFLKTFFESPLQDIAKLKQDLEYGWSFRNSSEPIKVKAKIFCDYVNFRLNKYLNNKYEHEIKLFTLMALLRILPYIRDIETMNWLNSSLKIFLDVNDL